jgi:hypothetical protein
VPELAIGHTVNKKKKVTDFAQDGDLEDDEYSRKNQGKCTTGLDHITGEARFYEGLTQNELEDKGFKRNNPELGTGLLLATDKDPKLPGGTATDNHSLSADWFCCPMGHLEETKLTVD